MSNVWIECVAFSKFASCHIKNNLFLHWWINPFVLNIFKQLFTYFLLLNFTLYEYFIISFEKFCFVILRFFQCFSMSMASAVIQKNMVIKGCNLNNIYICFRNLNESSKYYKIKTSNNIIILFFRFRDIVTNIFTYTIWNKIILSSNPCVVTCAKRASMNHWATTSCFAFHNFSILTLAILARGFVNMERFEWASKNLLLLSDIVSIGPEPILHCVQQMELCFSFWIYKSLFMQHLKPLLSLGPHFDHKI